MTGLTIKAIAKQHGFSPSYASLLTLKKGFPEPMEIIGRNKIYAPRDVAKYFAAHTKRSARRKTTK